MALLCAATLPAIAQPLPTSVVDRCTTDVEPGGVNLAQALDRGGRITFACPAPTTIRITQPHRVSRSFDLDGGNAVTLDGGGEQPFVEGVAPNLSLRLANVTVQKMSSTNTSGVIDGDLGLKITIENSRIIDSELPIGIAQGEVVVVDSRFERNRNAAISAPVVRLTRSVIRATEGQPVFSRVGEVTIVDSEIADNLAGSVFRRCSKATIVRTQFRGNRETSTGEREGGAAFRTDCDTDVENATFADNRSASNGGAIFARGSAARINVRGSRFVGNTAALNGGAIAVEAATTAQRLALQHTVFRGNGARRGGAIWLPAGVAGGRAELFGTGTTFTANTATERGGGVATDGVVVALSRAAFIRNAAPAGAAVSAAPAPGVANSFANALFVLNTGGAAFEGSGARFVNATILGSDGAGIVQAPAGPQAAIRFANTVIENNRGGNCVGDAAGFASDGGNLQFPGTSCGAGVTVAAAMLDTFYAPLIGGAARGNGRDEICAGPLVRGRDFYGKRRPEADHCSIGAVEGDLKRTVETVKPASLAASQGQCSSSGDRCTSECDPETPARVRTLAAGASPAEQTLAALSAVGIDFSIEDETELRSWLDTPDFTPYPAISNVLLDLARSRALRCPVFLDVVVFNYEHTPGVASPRRPADVRRDVLEAAVLEGYNKRHGTTYTKVSDLLR